MKTIPFFGLLLLLIPITLNAQIKMGDRPLVIDPNAILEIESNKQGILLPRMTTEERDAAFTSEVPNGLLIFNTETERFEVFLTSKQLWEPIQTSFPKIKFQDQILALDENKPLDLTPLLDNTDHQKLNLNGTLLSLENGGSVDLSALFPIIEPQQLQLEDGVLSLNGAGSVDLNELFTAAQDNQNLSLENAILKLERGGSVDLSSLFPISIPQKIDLFKLSSNTLELSLTDDGEPPHQIPLSAINTDHQRLTLSENQLSLSNGGSVDLSEFRDNKDQQQLEVSLTDSNTLHLKITNGNEIRIVNNGSLNFTKKESNTLEIGTELSSFATQNGITSNQSQDWENDHFVFGSRQLDNDPSTKDDNIRMFFDKSKAAFRAGIAQSDQWDLKNRGTYSVAMGRNTIASGFHSIAFGLSTLSDAWYSSAFGVGTAALSRAEMVIGSYNSHYTPQGGTRDWNPQDRLFVIGNGSGSSTASRSDALVMQKNGDTIASGVWIGPGFHVVSSKSKKRKIENLRLTTDRLLNLNPVQYELINRPGKTEYGFLAEEMELIFPNLVNENKGTKSVNYMGLIPLLINALKEQQNQIESLKSSLFKKPTKSDIPL